LVALVRQDPHTFGRASSRWRRVDLQAVVPWLHAYSLSGIGKALIRVGIRRKRGRVHLHSPDPDYAAKVAAIADVTTLAHRSPDRISVVYGDEMSLYRQPSLSDRWYPVGEEPTADLSHRANTRHRIAGSLDVVTGQVITTSGSKVGVKHLKAFLQALRDAYPGRWLVLIWDNWPVHTHEAVLAEAARLGIGIRWLPTYAPWLNPIEKLWRWVKQTVIHHHRLADAWDELKQRVAHFLGEFAHGSDDLLRYVGLWSD
jgi:transposase